MASILFESTDTDAPQLSDAPGSLLDVLRACLVDGYGSKASLGWETVFYDAATYKWVFRQKESKANRPYIRLVDDNGYSSYKYSNHVYIYDFMYDIDRGVNRQPISTDSNYASVFRKVDTTGNKPWKVIGDDFGFWFLVKHWDGDATYGDLWCPYYMGDFISWSLEYKYPFVWLPASYYGSFDFLGNGYSSGYLLRNLNNSVLSNNKYVYSAGVGGGQSPGNTGYPDYSANGIPYFGGADSYHPIILTTYNIWNPKYFIGRLPALALLKRADAPSYVINSFDPYVEVVDTNTKIMTFHCRSTNNNPLTGTSSRLSIVIGEGFRNVF